MFKDNRPVDQFFYHRRYVLLPEFLVSPFVYIIFLESIFRIGIDMVKDAVEISLDNENKEIKVKIKFILFEI